MSDFYTEQLVKRKTPGSSRLAVTALGVLAVASVLAILIIPFGIILPAALGFLTWFLNQRVNLEYEYLYVNGDLDIDKIMGRSKRKRIFSCNIKDVEIIAPEGSPELRPFGELKVKDLSSNVPEHKKYEMVLVQNGAKERVLFEPNQTILDGMRMVAPRKVFF